MTQSTDALSVQRRFVAIGSDPLRVVHLYHTGHGPAIFLLHPSPASGASFLPLLSKLGAFSSAYAIDTPGYGFSDNLQNDVTDLLPYVAALDATREALGIESVIIYGAATGSQIAVEYAKAFPKRCHGLVLDSVADFPAEEHDALVANYFPDLSVDFAGGHLMRVWTMALDTLRFFPWHAHGAANRLPAGIASIAAVQQMALQYLQAGPTYQRAYRVAFSNERADAIQPVTVPTKIIRWSGSVIKTYADRLDQHAWPDNIEMVHCGPSFEDRQSTVVAQLKYLAESGVSTSRTADMQPDNIQIVTTSVGELCVTSHASDADGHWWLLHDIGSSSRAVRHVAAQLTSAGAVFVPDLPGHGCSSHATEADESYVRQASVALREALKTFGQKRVKIVAMGESAAIALALMSDEASAVEACVLLNPLHGTVALPCNPTLDGTHLVALWHRLRNRQLFADADSGANAIALNGTPELSPDRINRQLIDRLQSDDVYQRALDSCRAVDVNELCVAMSERVRIAYTDGTTAAALSKRQCPKLDNVVYVSWSEIVGS